jgi:ribosomal protein L37E
MTINMVYLKHKKLRRKHVLERNKIMTNCEYCGNPSTSTQVCTACGEPLVDNPNTDSWENNGMENYDGDEFWQS